MKVLVALTVYFFSGFCLVAATDAPKEAPVRNAEASAQLTYSDSSARDALSSGDDQYCARVASDERQLGECLGVLAEYAEHELNDTYDAVMTHLSPIRQRALRKEERVWIKWRESECARQVKEVEDCVNGCGVPWTMRVVCMTEEARNHTRHLKFQWQR